MGEHIIDSAAPTENEAYALAQAVDRLEEAAEEAELSRANRDYVFTAVREGLEQLGYRVREPSVAIDFNDPAAALIADTPDGESLLFQHHEKGAFHIELFADLEPEQLDEAIATIGRITASVLRRRPDSEAATGAQTLL